MFPSAHSSVSSSRSSNGTDITIFERQVAIMHQRGESNLANDYRELLPHFWTPSMVKHDDGQQRSVVYPTMHYRHPAYLMHLETRDFSVEKTTHLIPNHNTGCNNNSSAMIPRPDLQCNSSSANWNEDILCIPCPNKKRKAELDLEEKGNNDNKVNDKNTNKAAEAETEKSREGQSEITTKTDRDNSTNTSSKVSEAQKPDYIHVRARRGQATDSHSLAERARREKISKKMKCLQDLVPGCERVTGKAGMLDEIINYVQSLQKQVEFLSMKLGTLKPRHEFNLDTILPQEVPEHMTNLLVAPWTKLLEATNSRCLPYHQMQVVETSGNCGIGCTTMNQSQGTSNQKDEGIITSSFLDPPTIHQQLQHLSGWDPEYWSSHNPLNFNFH